MKEGIVLKLSVVIPTVDEYEDIETVVRLIYDTCSHDDLAQIIFVYEEQSPDEYIAFLHTLSALYPEVELVTMKQPGKGVNDAICEGFFAAKGDHVVAIGADMENDPRDVALMTEIAKKHPDAIVTASRRLRKKDMRNYPPVKRFFNVAFQMMLHVMYRTKQSDITYLFQCTPKTVLYEYDMKSRVETFNLSMGLLPELYDIPFFEIPSTVGKRMHGCSHSKFSYYFSFIRAAVEGLKQKKGASR